MKASVYACLTKAHWEKTPLGLIVTVKNKNVTVQHIKLIPQGV
jgi:hypothetical protein